MMGLADLWYARRHQELLREAGREHLAREFRRARRARAGESGPSGSPTAEGLARTDAEVRRGLVEDAPRIAELLKSNGMPHWIAYEERFIVAYEDGVLVAALRFQEDFERLYLGLLVTDPQTEEHALAAALYAGARAMARGSGLREVRARTRRHQPLLRAAGYRRWEGGWRLDTNDPAR